MKIAFVGKGGSGKSSVSWLAVRTLEDNGSFVLAVDADHNMDLTSNLGLNPENTPLMHKTEREFMEHVGVLEEGKVSSVLTKDATSLPSFTMRPQDTYTASISANVSDTISLINIGLGSPEVMFSGKCAHGLSGPLKYYLGLLDEKDDFVVIDSVAGADMLNYGLYAGIDAVIGVVEPHRNSIKVFEQIQDICRKSLIPCFAVINKPVDNDFYKNFVANNSNLILGRIPFDENIMNYEYDSVKKETKEAMSLILEKVKQLRKRGNLASIKSFQEMKTAK
ncbi:MAG: AAA family ATPase [Candidatus Pacebacteria bacterium]|nr:AAA family ATPase [Candidatus Paceibacterota bacterium]MBP9867035.1 AAA family ATPase [Candidatus Paceibacterota bacterium]